MVVPNESGCRQRRCLAVDRHRRIVSERRWSLSETSCAVAETANTQMLTCSLPLSDSTREPSPTCVSTVYAKNHVCGGALLCRSSCEVCALEPRVRCGRDRCWILLKLYTHVQQWSLSTHHTTVPYTETSPRHMPRPRRLGVCYFLTFSRLGWARLRKRVPKRDGREPES